MSAPLEYIVYKINILKKAIVLISLVVVAAIFFNKGFSLGFFIGGFLSLANFSLLSKHILQIRSFSVRKAQTFIILRFLLMYLIMASALVIGIHKGLATFFGVASGLLTIKICIFLENLIGHTKIKFD